MNTLPHSPNGDPHRDKTGVPRDRVWPVWTRLWTLTCVFASGIFAMLWLLLRSGPKPGRLAYPCQQAALAAAALAFGGPLVAGLLAAKRRLADGFGARMGIAVAMLGLVITTGIWGYVSRAGDEGGPLLRAPEGYRAQIYHVTDCPQDPVGDRFVGLDNLISLMGSGGTKFYQSTNESLVAGPTGIIAADDVVVIKINYQWPERGGTNTDLLRGLIRRLVDHPDGFAGEVVVCENAQFNSVNNFDRTQNNAQDHALSPHDVVLGFQNLGYNVSHYDWTVRQSISVGEYSAGNMTDGYVVYAYDAGLHGRVSYPKFQTDAGTYVSLKYGLWDTGSSTYDRAGLKFINVPVLKSHHATYGATACVKHYMGVVTGSLSTSSHSAIGWGLLGALLGEIQLADLNILDSIWIHANPYDGPWTEYGEATRRDELLASVDPVATDIWAVKNILIPAFYDNGYSPPWPSPSADPDNPSSAFRVYLDRSMDEILAAGYAVTNDTRNIDTYTWDGTGDLDGDSDVDADDVAFFEACYTGPGGVIAPGCETADLDGDADVDCDDWDLLIPNWMGPGDPPELALCLFVPPAAQALGGRYIEVVPPSGIDPIALLLSGDPGDPDVSCVSKYIQADGTLGDTAVFMTPAQWGTARPSGAEIVPGAVYQLQADYGTPGSPILSPPDLATTWIWGDVDQSGAAEFDDILLVVRGYQDDFSGAALEALDLEPCAPDGEVTFPDILEAVKAYQNRPYTDSCALPCP